MFFPDQMKDTAVSDKMKKCNFFFSLKQYLTMVHILAHTCHMFRSFSSKEEIIFLYFYSTIKVIDKLQKGVRIKIPSF